MSKRDFLLEIGLEEMPARFIQDALDQLKAKLDEWLKEHGLEFTELAGYATPRRLAILVKELAERQGDRVEVVRGPAKKIALDEEGNWTKAALGFARSQGVDVAELTFREVKGVEYIFVEKKIKGLETEALLSQIKELITGLSFPKHMRWGAYDLRFVRPIRWLVALFGETIIPMEITGIRSGNVTWGHRFLGEKISLNEPKEYVEALRREYVIASIEERREMIVNQLDSLAKERGWQIPIDQALLEEVTHLVEYPTAIYGQFETEFLEIPSEVLVTSMKEHQRYFPVQDKTGNLLPYFVTIRNGLEDKEGIVVRGNEKVLRARLADARFFYEEDKKLKINEALKELDQIVFHEELGSLGAKVNRVTELAGKLATILEIDEETERKIERTAKICKFDLVSQMVGEFPELQGIMGEKYARLQGEDEEVSQGIREHYLPRFAGDELPSQTVGAVVSVADKLDTLASCFAIGIQPTGSQDPYALRRQATGIVQIILAKDWPLTLEQLLDLSLSSLRERKLLKEDEQKVRKELAEFFKLRIKNRMQEEGIRYDIIEASLNRFAQIPLPSLLAKARVLVEEAKNDSFKPLVEAFNRVNNLAEKLDRNVEVEEELFTEAAERDLWTTYAIVRQKFSAHAKEGNWQEAFNALKELAAPIEAYFDTTMVMVDQEHIRYNRLASLDKVAGLIKEYADFSQIVFSAK